jgi:hypothetical protein
MMIQKITVDDPRPDECFVTHRRCTQINNHRSCAQCKKFKLQKPRYGTGFKFPECISKVIITKGASPSIISMLQNTI